MDIYYPFKRPKNGVRYGLGFKSKSQLPLIMIWKEYISEGETLDAKVLYSSYN
jgi:hypothetical protein